MPPQRGNPTSKTSLNQISNIASLRKASTMGISFLGHPSCVASTANQRETEGIPNRTHVELGSAFAPPLGPSFKALPLDIKTRLHPATLACCSFSASLRLSQDISSTPRSSTSARTSSAQASKVRHSSPKLRPWPRRSGGGRGEGGRGVSGGPGLERKAEAGGSLKDPQVEAEVECTVERDVASQLGWTSGLWSGSWGGAC